MNSPRILHHPWGTLEGEGHPAFKDVKLFPGGAREWDWSVTGTKHVPGVQQADIAELLDKGASTLVLSCGVRLQLLVADELVEWLEDQGMTVHVLQSDLAVAKYNELLAAQVPVGTLIHSTC